MPDNCVYTFENNTLLIRDQYTATELQWGEKPIAKEQLGAGSWKEGSTHQRVLVPKHIDARENREAIDAFSGLIPRKFRKITEPFADHQWMVLKLLAQNPYYTELAESNPILAYCLANNEQFRNVHHYQAILEQANMYSRRKQKLILQWLGYPSTGIAVNLMKKIDCNEMTVGLMRLLRASLQQENPTTKLLSHYQSVTPGMLGLLRSTITPSITPELVSAVANDPAERMNSRTGDKLTEIYIVKRTFPGKFHVPQFRSIRAVNDYHERLEAKHKARIEKLRQIRIRKEKIFDDPPIAGTEDIVPITTKAGLKIEGKDMKNCVASYISRIKRSEIYIYKVLNPERATLSIAQNIDGSWGVSELKGKCNRPVDIDTQATVHAWIRNASHS